MSPQAGKCRCVAGEGPPAGGSGLGEPCFGDYGTSFLFFCWSGSSSPNLIHQGPPRPGAVWGVLMWLLASLNSHSPRLRARDVGLLSFFQLHKYFKGVDDTYEIKKWSRVPIKQYTYPVILLPNEIGTKYMFLKHVYFKHFKYNQKCPMSVHCIRWPSETPCLSNGDNDTSPAGLSGG